jgi:hypothetical protein
MANRYKERKIDFKNLPIGLQVLTDLEGMREAYKRVPKLEKGNVVAYLYSVYGGAKTAQIVGIAEQNVTRHARRHKDIVQFAQVARAATIIELCQRKALALLQTLDVEQVPHERRAQSIKYLMDAAADAAFGAPAADGEAGTVTKELIFRVTERMGEKGAGGGGMGEQVADMARRIGEGGAVDAEAEFVGDAGVEGAEGGGDGAVEGEEGLADRGAQPVPCDTGGGGHDAGAGCAGAGDTAGGSIDGVLNRGGVVEGAVDE